jgi:hypothetical protein
LYNTSGKRGIGHNEADVQWVAISAEGLGDKSIITGIVHTMMDDTVKFETPQFVVIFVFIVGTFWDVYYDIDIAFGLVYESGKVIDEMH